MESGNQSTHEALICREANKESREIVKVNCASSMSTWPLDGKKEGGVI